MKYAGQLLLALFIFIFAEPDGYCQGPGNNYSATTAEADSLFSMKNYSKAVTLYQKAFDDNAGLGKVGHRYRAAGCFAMLNMKDSAFSQLDKIAGKGKFSRLDMIRADSNFLSLHSDPRWESILKTIEENRKKRVILDN